MSTKTLFVLALAVFLSLSGTYLANAWTPVPVKEDPLVRMPGTQPFPENNPDIESPTRCTNCHGGFDSAVEPAFNWQGSMMAQAARDYLFWSCLVVGAQDSIWAAGRPNATDICLRCHFTKGWLEGRSDPTNGSAMTGTDFDGVQCDFCHSMFDPFFETTYDGSREGSDWAGYWDEATSLSQTSADETYADDKRLAQGVLLFNGGKYFTADAQGKLLPPTNYMENASGQYFMDDTRDKRASFADANARHGMFYSRYHKSKYFCATCHDVSNPVLANLGADPTQPLPTEVNSAFSYFHVERTFSEFMLSDYGQPGGAPGIGPFDPQVYDTSYANNYIAKCQDCHMRDSTGKACSQNDGVNRPTDSAEHQNSGQPIHDLTGGNAWVSAVLASAISGSPNYDPVNDSLLNQGANVLTLDLTQGLGIDPVALLAGVDRAKQQLTLAASIQNVTISNGALSFRIQNQTGHKLISGFPEGRRMFINIKAYDTNMTQVYEVNPYDHEAGTLKGLHYPYQPDPDTTVGPALPLPLNLGETRDAQSNIVPTGYPEIYIDELVYEMHPESSLTGEAESFHFALATDRHKDNRIPPKGFRIAEAGTRLSTPVYYVNDVNIGADYFTADEYLGGYDEVVVSSIPGTATYIEITLSYQTTSREYIEFLRDEINGTGNLTLSSPTPSGEPNAYIVQNDQWFTQLKAWGDTIWKLWKHNMNVNTAAPFPMAQAIVGTPPTPPCDTPGAPQNLTATAVRKNIDLVWEVGTPAPTGGYHIYYDQAGKLQFITSVNNTTLTYRDTGLQKNTPYCYVVKAWNDCDGDGVYTLGVDTESAPSNTACDTT